MSDGVDHHSRAELYRIVDLGDGPEDARERMVDELARAVLDANALLDKERPRPTTGELLEESMDALVSHGGVVLDHARREARRRLLRDLPDPVLRALLVAFNRKRRRKLPGPSVDALTLGYNSWIGHDPRYLEILEELPGPHGDDLD